MAKKAAISSELIALYNKLAAKADGLTLVEQLKILDRGIKIEQIKHRLKDSDGFGADFDQPDDPGG